MIADMEDINLEKSAVAAIEKGGDLERLKFHLDRVAGSNVVLILFSYPEAKYPIESLLLKIKKIIKECSIKTKVDKISAERIKNKMKKSSKNGYFEEVKCKFARSSWIFPLIHGGITYGYLCVIVEKGVLAKEILDFVEDYLAISLEKALKELELIKVHGTLRPRAIALSSVHTVHRLISSTLNMNELLPRLARLCTQVTRAKMCVIYIRKKNYLKPQAVASVDSNLKPAKISILHSNVGRTLEEGSIILNRNVLWVPLIEEDLIGSICLRQKQSGKAFDSNDREILSVLAEQAVVAIKNAQLYETQNRILLESLKSLSKALDAKSPRTYTHPDSFVDLVLAIADEYGVAPEEKEYIKYATLLLDTGKLAVPETILKKPDFLTEEEYNSVKAHPIKSAEIVKSIKTLKPVVPIILHHHERYDGKGYPKGLKGAKIPLGARILAVADTFEAMICHRPYKKSVNFRTAISEIEKHSGEQFDPEVVAAFKRAVKKGKIQKIFHRMQAEIKQTK